LNKIRLIHWNSAEAKHLAEKLKEIGYQVTYEMPSGPDLLRELGKNPPDAVVIDLSRLPSQGRDMALAIRHQKSTRHLPLIFVEGEADKIARIKEHLPDAVYTTWSNIAQSLKHAIAHPPKDPLIPQSRMDGYSGASLGKKLGFKASSVVVLVNAPKDFEKSLGKLPEGVIFRKRDVGPRDLTIWFAESVGELESRIRPIASLIENGGLWIAWPKKTSGMSSDLTQNHVRKIGLASGLIDFKICSIDETWSGLLFTRRKSK
jgi:CheY-like chemotaxis protein